MPTKNARRQKRLVLALDGDKLGHVMGAAIATVVLIVCFFYRDVELIPALIRAGWAFVVSYAVTFLLARIVLRTALTEMVTQRKMQSESAGNRAEESSTPEP